MMGHKHHSLATVIAALALTICTNELWALSTGIVEHSGNPNVNQGNTCVVCHTGGIAPTAILTGPNSIEAGSVNTFTLSMSGGQQNLGGFNISASRGTLRATGSGMAVESAELKHTRTFSLGSAGIDWTFDFEAPPIEGAVTIYATALSADGDNAMTGDNSTAVRLTVQVTPAQRLLPPSASINGPYFTPPATDLQMDASASIDGDGTIQRYLWDFGDGSAFAQGAMVTHNYAAEGTYIVTMAATDNDGLTAATASTVNVSTNPGSAQGEALYNQLCFACHGPNGDGGSARAINSATAEQILAAIPAFPSMNSINLSPEQAQLISDFLLSGGGEPPARPTDGPGLYGMFCSACHGSDGRGGNDIGVTGAPYAMISEAVQNIPTMQSIDMSLEELQLVADFLTAGGAGEIPTDANGLYDVFCAVCHGAGGHGGKFLAVTGASTQMVTEAIANIAWMQPLPLDQAQIQSVADYLSAGGEPPLPTTASGLYNTFCAVCHGAGGHGGKFIAVTGASQQMISEAINNEPWMGQLQLTQTQTQQIASYLGAGGEPPLPTSGAGLYGVYCAVCHGAGGHGGKYLAVTGAPATMINNAIANENWMTHLNPSTSQVNAIANYLLSGGSSPVPTDGAGLYGVFCSVCHGADGRGGIYKIVTGTSSGFINNALNGVNLMRQLQLNSTQIQRITSYLAAGGGGAKPTTGSGLYQVYCETCHGPNGSGGSEGNVTGESASSITSKINGESDMRQLQPYLTANDINLISSFLRGQ